MDIENNSGGISNDSQNPNDDYFLSCIEFMENNIYTTKINHRGNLRCSRPHFASNNIPHCDIHLFLQAQ